VFLEVVASFLLLLSSAFFLLPAARARQHSASVGRSRSRSRVYRYIKKKRRKKEGRKPGFIAAIVATKRASFQARARARAMRICDQRSSHFSDVISDSIRHPLIRAFSPSRSLSRALITRALIARDHVTPSRSSAIHAAVSRAREFPYEFVRIKGE